LKNSVILWVVGGKFNIWSPEYLSPLLHKSLTVFDDKRRFGKPTKSAIPAQFRTNQTQPNPPLGVEKHGTWRNTRREHTTMRAPRSSLNNKPMRVWLDVAAGAFIAWWGTYGGWVDQLLTRLFRSASSTSATTARATTSTMFPSTRWPPSVSVREEASKWAWTKTSSWSVKKVPEPLTSS